MHKTVQYPSRNAIFQEGPKNPLKGTSMKSLVSAFYAQFRVDAGGEGFRAHSNGMEYTTRFPWRLVACATRDGTPIWEASHAYESGMNLQCSAQNRVAACSVACLE